VEGAGKLRCCPTCPAEGTVRLPQTATVTAISWGAMGAAEDCMAARAAIQLDRKQFNSPWRRRNWLQEEVAGYADRYSRWACSRAG